MSLLQKNATPPASASLFFWATEFRAPLVALMLTLQATLALLSVAWAFALARAGETNAGRETSAIGVALFVWAVAIALLAAASRWIWFADERRPPAADALVRYLPLAAAAITAASIATTGASLFPIALAWILLAAEELAVMGILRHGSLRGLTEGWAMFRAWQPAPRKVGPTTAHPATARQTTGPVERPNTVRETQTSADDCVQRIVRAQAIDGGDHLQASLSTRLDVGQTTAQIHVAFCPSFARVPALDFRQIAGPAARVKLGQLLPHGARFEVKLSDPATAVSQVTLEVLARLAPVVAAAERDNLLIR